MEKHPVLFLALSLACFFFSAYMIEIEKKVTNGLAWIAVRMIATLSLIGGYTVFMSSVMTLTPWSFWPAEIAFIFCLMVIAIPTSEVMK